MPGLTQSTIRRTGLVIVVAALGTAWAAPAHAADQAVSVLDNSFVPALVGVVPGEKVTWTAGSAALNPHNLVFEDGLITALPAPGPWTADRTFSAAGTFRYYCQIHGAAGGLGMAGIVYANAAANVLPAAVINVAPNVPQPGEPVSFSASGSSDPDGTLTGYDWDLDGNGSYETSTGATPSTSSTYATAGTRTIRLRVTDNSGGTAETSRGLRVNSQPTASFTISPNPALTGTVTFDGSASSDTDGSIARYEWDFDGNGSFETDTGGTATTARSRQVAGTSVVRLRVTDHENGKGETQRSLQVNARPLLPSTPVVTPSSRPERPGLE